MSTADLIWMNGEFVAWEDAKVHVLTHAMHYGTGVFEGIRCYETEQGPAVFRHQDHLDRLRRSAALYHMDLPYAPAELLPPIRDLHVVELRGVLEPVQVVVVAEDRRADLGVVAADALEDARAVVQPVGQYVHRRVLPLDELPVHPDEVAGLQFR